MVSRIENRETAQRSDEELLLLARRGDVEAFRLLHERYRGPVTRYLYAGCGNAADAEELCQDVFLRIFRFAHHFQPGLEFRPWLFTITGNELRRHFRKKAAGTVGTVVLDAVPEPAVGASHEEAVETRDAVLQALDRLPIEQRDVVIMKEYGGLTFAEIALVIDCSENTVKSRMYYGLSKLREYLKEFAPDAR